MRARPDNKSQARFVGERNDLMANLPNGNRPRARAMVRLDLSNAYARLGVSPLMSTEEIKAVVDRKRKELMRQRRDRAQQEFGKEEAEITELQAIEAEIGSPRARTRYDQANPQNELLTVQPSPHDRWLDPAHRANLISAWLMEELGRDAILPSPESLCFWAPKGIDPELADLLARFGLADNAPSNPVPIAPNFLPEVSELEQLSQTDPSRNDSSIDSRKEPVDE
jgi:hypothetical protein